MRLLKFDDCGQLSLTDDLTKDIPNYAILSHTWGDDGDEVTYKDLLTGSSNSKAGYKKLRFCGEHARKDELQYFWVDTCCIDRSSSAELQEALTLMFRWYHNAAKCYVYLSDVTTRKRDFDQTARPWEPAFRRSRWFTRGWTLQELLASTEVQFFSREEEFLGDKQTLEQLVHEITGIPVLALRGQPLSDFSVDERLAWALGRETQKEEDQAYCLLGIFNVFMPLIYGEGQNALVRLKDEIERSVRSTKHEKTPKAHQDLILNDMIMPSVTYLVPGAEMHSFVRPRALDDQAEVLYMQVFVEEVGPWMDGMDAESHFSRIFPFMALDEPMLKYAILACGARHLTQVNSAYPESIALGYYNNASRSLLKCLKDPERNSSLCATTAVILNIYEVMAEKLLQRMNHIAGARALIKQCRWSASSTGIGAACFWINVWLELAFCLQANWGVAWDPDTWGIDMVMRPQPMMATEEHWTQKMCWILSKINNFRSRTKSAHHNTDSQTGEALLQQRHQEWLDLRQLCARWNLCAPPTMHAMAYLPAHLTSSDSHFPDVWYIKRTTTIARLLYHTALALLGTLNPLTASQPETAATMERMTIHNSRQVCAIVAYVKDRGVCQVAVTCLAIVGEYLVARREQVELLLILEKVKKDTGWELTPIPSQVDLKRKWGWNDNAQ